MGSTKDIPRTKMTYDEYTAYQELGALVGTIGGLSKRLEKRLRTVPGGWRDARMLDSVTASLMTRLCDTIPADKLLAIRREIEHTQVFIRTIPDYCARSRDGVTYVNEEALDRLVQRVMDFECHMCERNRVDAKRCQVRKDIEAVYHFGLDVKKTDDSCPLMGMSLVREKEDTDA